MKCWIDIQLYNDVYIFMIFSQSHSFLTGILTFEGLFDQVTIQKAEMLFQFGKIDEADKLIDKPHNTLRCS